MRTPYARIMSTRRVIVPEDAFSRRTAVLNTLYQMQKSSTYTDCTLVPCTGSPIHIHLAVLALAWPDLHHLLPPIPPHCSCDCSVPTITLCADAWTVQLMVEVAYTGKAVLVGTGEEEYEKLGKLSQSLGLKWVLDKVESRKECKKPKTVTSHIKEFLDNELLLPAANVQEVVVNSVLDSLSVIPEASRRSKEGRESFPRRVKINTLEKPKLKVSIKKKSIKNRTIELKPEACFPHDKVSTNDENGNINISPSSATIYVKKTLIAPGTLMTNVDNLVKFFCSYCQQDITKFSKLEKESHWALVHFSEQLSQFTTDQKVCKLCKFKADDEIEITKHVGVTHKKIYDFLSVVPSKVMAMILKARLKNLCTGDFTQKNTPNYSQSNANHASMDLNGKATFESVGTFLPNSTVQHTHEFNIDVVAEKENKDVERLNLKLDQDCNSEDEDDYVKENFKNQNQNHISQIEETNEVLTPKQIAKRIDTDTGKGIGLKTVELKVGKIPCKICGKLVKNTNVLKQHVRFVHDRKGGEFPCDQCGKIMKSKGSLEYHSKVHVGDYAYRCDECGNGYMRFAQMLDCKNTHAGIFKFHCTHCEYKSNNTKAFKNHITIHSTEKPFICPLCNYSSNTSTNLGHHTKRVHKITLCQAERLVKKTRFGQAMTDNDLEHNKAMLEKGEKIRDTKKLRPENQKVEERGITNEQHQDPNLLRI